VVYEKVKPTYILYFIMYVGIILVSLYYIKMVVNSIKTKRSQKCIHWEPPLNLTLTLRAGNGHRFG